MDNGSQRMEPNSQEKIDSIGTPRTMDKQKRILVVTRNLPPLVGGMERLNWHMIKELSRYQAVSVIGPKDSKPVAPPVVKYQMTSLSPLPYFLASALWSTLSLARKWKPNIVLAGSGLTAPVAWLAARLSNARAVAYLHGLDIVVENRLYRWLWLPFIRRMDRVIVNSQATKGLATSAGIPATKIGIVHPGVDLPQIDEQGSGDAFRQRHNLTNAPILLSVGRLTERKGIKEFVISALPGIAKRNPNVKLLIIGGQPEDALAARGQPKESILAAAMKAGVANNVKFLGRVSDYELSEAFDATAAHIFPIRELPGDPEGFGMVAVEAAAHGVPTIAFRCGGVVDAVNNSVTGWLVNPGDYSAFAQKVTDSINAEKSSQWSTNCLNFAKEKTWSKFGSNLQKELTLIQPEHHC